MQKKALIIITSLALCLATFLTAIHATDSHPNTYASDETISPTINIEPIPVPSEDAPHPTIPEISGAEESVAVSNEPVQGFAPFTSYLYGEKRLNLPLSAALQEHTYQMSLKYNAPYRVILGVLGAESGWRADIGIRYSADGTAYVGLGMLTEKYHAQPFADKGIDIYTPEGNIEAICIVIRQHLDNFDDNMHYALMAYNLGPNSARKAIANGTYTTEYSRNVHHYAESFR